MSEGAPVGQAVYNQIQVQAQNLRGAVRYVATGVIPATTLFSANAITGECFLRFFVEVGWILGSCTKMSGNIQVNLICSFFLMFGSIGENLILQ